MDWSLLIGMLILIVGVGSAIFIWRGFVHRLKDDFHAEQPDLRLTNLSALHAGDVITLTPELENVGEGVAYDCVLQLSGWEGNFTVKSMYPPGPRHQTHAIPIVLGPDAPIRVKPLSRCSLRIAYRDHWELRYERWYPVSQVYNIVARLYDVHIELSQPEVTQPNLSTWKMWRFLRTHSADD